MSKLKLTLLSSVLCAGLIPAGMAQAQDTQPQLQQTRQVIKKRMQEAKPRAPRGSFIRKQHRSLKCGKGERKRLIIHGREDNFSSSGSELLNRSSRVANNPATGWNQGLETRFDGTTYNRKVFDSITMPQNVRSGKVMIGMKTIGELVNTDGFSVGNLGAAGISTNQRKGFAYNNGWSSMTGSGWQNSGTNYASDFSNITLMNGQTLEDYYRTSGDRIIDAYVQDDHSVDYFAVSVCFGKRDDGGNSTGGNGNGGNGNDGNGNGGNGGNTGGPASKKMGMTWGIRTPLPESVNGVAHVGCNDKDGVKCDPYKGDTLCTEPRPILCLNPMRLQKPQNLTESRWDKWSGGIIGTTNPMPAPSTLAQANSECVKEFGPGWRVAEHHDAYPGSSGWVFSAYGNVGTKSKRYWTDIRNQPNGICWTR